VSRSIKKPINIIAKSSVDKWLTVTKVNNDKFVTFSTEKSITITYSITTTVHQND